MTDKIIKKAARVWRDDGLITLILRGVRFGYDLQIRPLLPRRVVSYNGVSVRASRFGDSIVPWHNRDIPGYEDALNKGIRRYVEDGDTVVVVGGGWGVTTVISATESGSGRVITFEAGAETVTKIEETLQINNVRDDVSVRHAIVAKSVSVRGDASDAQLLRPSDLPDCDVLVLDCEGAEKDIIRKMNIRPRVVLVETHGVFDAPETDIRNKLYTAGYKVTESMVAEDRLRGVCERNDIYVLFSIRRQAKSD